MKTPPLLIGAALLFWGWQTGDSSLLIIGAVMGLILESARFIRLRWEFTDDEFARVLFFCVLLFLAAIFYVFHDNGGLSTVSQLFEDPTSTTERNAGNVSQMTVDVVFRWLPMIFFLFVAAQAFSSVDGAPLEIFFFLLRSRIKRARKKGHRLLPSRRFDASYPYFALCLFSAAGRAMRDDYFYYGFCFLLVWALWPQRSRRFALMVWVVLVAVVVTLGFYGQRRFGQLSRLAEDYDPQIVSLFWHPLDPNRTFTSIGDVDRMKRSGKIVIRLEALDGARPPTYLREASYRYLEEVPAGSYPNVKHRHMELEWETANTNNNYVPVYETPLDSGIFPLHTEPANRSVVNIACYLTGISEDENRYPEGWLPLPADCNRLENSRAYSVSQSGLGMVRAEGPRLMIFQARYGSGEILDDQPEVNASHANEDLYVPPNEIPALQTVVSNLNVSGKSDEKKILAVARFFKNNFTYSLWQDKPSLDTNTTALARFLNTTHRGHCEYFATATVLLLRELGIPARYAVGYYVHEPSGNGYVVRLRDGHAWCLVWVKKKHCWENFDTTPPSWVGEEEARASPFQFLSDFQSWLGFEILKFFDYNHNDIRDYVFWALIPALAFLLYRIFRGGRRQQKGSEPLERLIWPGVDSEFYQLEQKLAHGGLPREAGESLSAWLRRVTDDSRLTNFKQPLENILALHYRYRFDPRGLNASERQALRREVEECLSSVSGRGL